MPLQNNFTGTMLNPEIFRAVFNAHGSYSTEQFVLRLSPKNHSLLEKVTLGDFDPANIDSDIIQAYSTYIHETIHWWQHIGSTSGLVLSMCYPLQIHSTLEHIQTWCSLGGSTKSIKTAATKGELAGKTHSDAKQAAANVIVNNTMDLQLFREWLLDPENVLRVYNDPHFESQGHCFRIVYSDLLFHVHKLIDPSTNTLPDPEQWIQQFNKLNADKTIGYYYGSPIPRRPVGVKDLFEGQACFSQMQFLAKAGLSSGRIDEFRQSGMLYGVYERAFVEYLKATNVASPENVNDPKIGLFLLICDLAINPMEGLLCQITDFPNFVNHADPGIRFVLLCRVVAQAPDELLELIEHYSKDEYLELASILSEAAGFLSPSEGWKAITKLQEESSSLRDLMNQHRTLQFNDNVVLRVLLSHFVSFSADKSEHPHFFCWPGYWKANANGDTSIKSLWLKNLSLFSDQEYDDGIFIRQLPGVSSEDLENTLNNFFGNIILSNLTRQWVLEDGDFSFDFKWLSKNHDRNHWKKLAKEAFQRLYGIDISSMTAS